MDSQGSVQQAKRSILHVVLRPRFSGVETLVMALLPLHVASGHRAAFCALLPTEEEFAPELDRLRESGCEIFVPDKELNNLDRLLHASRTIREFKPDLIIAHTVIPAAYVRAAAIMTGWRVFPRKDRHLAIALQSATNKDYSDLVLRLPEKVLTYFMDKIITVNDEAKASYKELVREHPNMVLIRNGINLERYSEPAKRRESIRTKLGLQGKKLVLQVGRLSPVKQQHLSFEALQPLLRQNSDLLLWLPGLVEDEAYVEKLRQDIESSDVASQVVLLGSRSDIPELLAAADVYLMPSTNEAHSLAMIEALASGVATVASNISTFEYIRDFPGVTLTGVDDAEAMRKATEHYLVESRRYERNLVEFDINTTEKRYASFE